MSFTPKQIEMLQKASNDFVYFTNNIFSLSTKNFIGGEHVDSTARILSQNKRTMRVSARHHFKSYSLYSYILWILLFEGASTNIEAHYFSFNEALAGYHISKIKNCITANPFFADIHDCKPIAESVLKYTWDNKNFFTLTPHGLIQFKRGIHSPYIFVDDPFQDPDNLLNPTMIYKINEVFKSNILDMPSIPDGELHVIGTCQSNEDFFFDKKITKSFAYQFLPAIQTNLKTGKEEALWPEWMTLERLREIREERTVPVFNREYMCTPVYSTKGFFEKDFIKKKIVNEDLVDLKPLIPYQTKNDVIAGFDIGKKTDPSHLSVFEYRNGKLVMIHQKWMDNWPYSTGKSNFMYAYPSQLEYLKMCIKNFKIKQLCYDNTRGEFESLDDQDLLPREMVPFVFRTKTKQTIATAFSRLVEKQQIEILNDDRLINQICVVTNDFQALRSKEGHADSFWSICLAISCAKDLVGFYDEIDEKRHIIKTGQKSIFSAGMPIPSGF